MIIFRFSRINNESTKAKDYANVKHNTAPCACKNREMSLLDKFRNDLESSVTCMHAHTHIACMHAKIYVTCMHAHTHVTCMHAHTHVTCMHAHTHTHTRHMYAYIHTHTSHGVGCASSCDGGDGEDVLLDDVESDGELGVDCCDMLSDSNVVLLTKALKMLVAPTLVMLLILMSSFFSEWLRTSPAAMCSAVKSLRM